MMANFPNITYEDFQDEKKILVGSRAVRLNQAEAKKPNSPSFRPEKNNCDFDYLLRGAHKNFYGRGLAPQVIEAHGIPEEVFDLIEKEVILWNAPNCSSVAGVPDNNTLYTIKLSHAQFDINWDKTMWDINWFQEHNYKCIPELYDRLYDFWLSIHETRKANINLNKTNEEFFKDGVKRIYVHDDLHEIIKYYAIPLHKAMKHDTSKAMIDKDLFDLGTKQEKLRLCREEIYVTALERFWIPTDGQIPSALCYKRAIKKLVTTMTKGWFPKFILENYKELKTPDKDYVQLFNKALAEGRIKKI